MKADLVGFGRKRQFSKEAPMARNGQQAVIFSCFMIVRFLHSGHSL